MKQMHQFAWMSTVLACLASHCALQAQPGYEAMPIALWILESEDISNRNCSDAFSVTAELISERDLHAEPEPTVVAPLLCRTDTVQHVFYDANLQTHRVSFTETIPAFCSVPAEENYLVKSIRIAHTDGRIMKLKTDLYITKDALFYSHGNNVSIPTVIFFKPGEFHINEVRFSPEANRIREMYKQTTGMHHQQASEQIRNQQTYKARLSIDPLTERAGYVAVRVLTSAKKYLDNVQVTARFEDGTIKPLKFENTAFDLPTYLYQAPLDVPYAPARIVEIKVEAAGYNLESFVPKHTVHEVTLFRTDEDYLYHTGFQKIPFRFDPQYLSVFLPQRVPFDTTGFATALAAWGLEVDHAYDMCNAFFEPGVRNAMLLRKKNGQPFDDRFCPELGWLRSRFKDICVSPGLFSASETDPKYRKRAIALTHQILLTYHSEDPRMKALFDAGSLEVVPLPLQRGYLVSLPLDMGPAAINQLAGDLKSSGLFTDIEHQFFEIICVD